MQPALGGGEAQRGQRGIPAQVGIHLGIIDHIVAVIAVGGEDGVEIQGIHAQVFEIVETLNDAWQVAAVELHHGAGAVAGGSPQRRARGRWP